MLDVNEINPVDIETYAHREPHDVMEPELPEVPPAPDGKPKVQSEEQLVNNTSENMQHKELDPLTEAKSPQTPSVNIDTHQLSGSQQAAGEEDYLKFVPQENVIEAETINRGPKDSGDL